MRKRQRPLKVKLIDGSEKTQRTIMASQSDDGWYLGNHAHF